MMNKKEMTSHDKMVFLKAPSQHNGKDGYWYRDRGRGGRWMRLWAATVKKTALSKAVKRLAAIIAIATTLSATAQDTTIRVQVPYSFQVTRTVQGTRTVNVKVPLPKPDTVYIYQCPPTPPPPSRRLALSAWQGSQQAFIDSAIRGDLTAVIDQPMQVVAPIVVRGNLRIVGAKGVTLTINTPRGFVTGNGQHQFDSLDVRMARNSVFIFTEVGVNVSDSISNSSITGGSQTYQTSAGRGVTAFHNVTMSNSHICISIYSQSGNGIKSLHLSNVRLSSDSSYAMYVHPNVNIRFDDVDVLKTSTTGKNPFMALQYFSSNMDTANGKARYFEFNNVRSTGRGMYTVVGPDSGHAIIRNSNIALYKVGERVKADSTTFYNSGQGCIINGTLTNCNAAEVGVGGGLLTLEGGAYEYVTTKVGGMVILDNVAVSQLQVGERSPFKVFAKGGRIGYVLDFKQSAGNVYLTDTPMPPNNARPGVIK